MKLELFFKIITGFFGIVVLLAVFDVLITIGLIKPSAKESSLRIGIGVILLALFFSLIF